MNNKYGTYLFRVSTLLASLVLASSLHAQATKTVVIDAVENITDWTRLVTNTLVNNNVYDTRGDLTATAGTYYWLGGNVTGTGTPNRGIYQYFSGVSLEVGIYTVTFDIALPTNVTSFVGNLEISLLADTNGAAGSYNYNERLEASALTKTSATTPESGKWETWTYTFEVTAETANRLGDTVVGSGLGFLINAAVADGTGYAFDNLVITYAPIPEPSMISALVGLAALGATICIRRFRRA